MSTNNYAFPWGIYIGNIISRKTIPLFLDSQQGGFCVLFDDSSEEIANNFIENIALKLFEIVPMGNIVVDIFDFGKPRFLTLSSLKTANFSNLYNVSFSEKRAVNRFEELNELIDDRNHNLLSIDSPTLSEYNQNNKTEETYYLLLINLDDFPNKSYKVKQIEHFFVSSFNAGFYTIAFGKQSLVKSNSKETQAILNKFPVLAIKNQEFKLSKELFEFSDLLKAHDFEYVNDDKPEIINQLLEKLEEEQENDEKDFLHIPIGKIGQQKLYFSMGLKSQNYHAFIAGMTGMGKTNLLNTIIVNIAKHYTAKEIELYLMDYKPAGAEFMIFKQHPNCKKLFLDNKNATPAFEILKELKDEMYHIGEVLNGKSIDEYNTMHPEKIIPRKILIIDEVQRMFSSNWKESNNFNELVEDIVKSGRSFGLHLVLTTQSLKQIKMNDSIMGQIPLKVSFRLNDSMEALKIFHENKKAISDAIKLKKYHLVLSDFNKTVVAKADYIDKDKIEKTLQSIRNKRQEDETLTPVIKTKNNQNNQNNQNNIKYNTDSGKLILEKLKKIKK